MLGVPYTREVGLASLLNFLLEFDLGPVKVLWQVLVPETLTSGSRVWGVLVYPPVLFLTPIYSTPMSNFSKLVPYHF